MDTKITKSDLIDYFQKHPSPSIPPDFGSNLLTPASVLVPIIDDAHGLQMLFTKRTSHLKNHAGQISFPGGKKEPQDLTLQDTAIRETIEEIGLKQQQINILGHLSPLSSSTGFFVTPYISLITPPLELTLGVMEVAAVITIPLDYLLNAHNHQQQNILINNQQHTVYVIEYEKQQVWGLTAKVIVNLAQELTRKSPLSR